MSGSSSLPVGWAAMSITEFCVNRSNAIKRGPFGSTLKKQFFVSSGIKVYEQQHAIRNDFTLGKYYINEEKFEELKAFEVNPKDLIISCSGTIGKIAIVPEWAEPGIINQALLKLTLNERLVTNRYFVQLFEHLSKQVIDSRGSGMQNLAGVKELKKVEFPVPPLNEQHRIVEKLDELFSELDAGLAALERAKANLKRYRASVLKVAVNGSLTADWRANHPEVEPASQLLERILAERRRKWEEEQLAKFEAAGKKPPKDWEKKYKESTRPSTRDLSALPATWTWITVEQSANTERSSITDGPFGSNLKSEHYTDEGPLVIRLQNIGDGYFVDDKAHISRSHFEKLGKHQVQSGDVVVAILGSELPRACQVPEHVPPAIVKADCVRVSCDEVLCRNAYLMLALNSLPTRARAASLIAGVGRPRLNLQKLKSIAVPLPPVDEQIEIVSEVERQLSIVEAAEKTIEENLLRSKKLRQGILKSAFEGKLVPQDLTDESAKSLLARIASEQVEEHPKKAGKGKAKARKQIKLPKQVFEHRAAVVSYTVQRLTSSQSFGRIQLLKTMHLAQCHLGIEMGFSFERYEAGPFDAAIYPLEKVAIKEDWFTTKERKRYGVTYHPGEKIDQMCQKGVDFLGEKKSDLDQLLDHIAEMNTDEAELFATAYAAWNDLLLDGRPADDDAIIEEIYAWHEKKKKFKPQVIRERLTWMQENCYLPCGKGKMTESPSEASFRRTGR